MDDLMKYFDDECRIEGEAGGLAQVHDGYVYRHEECGRLTFYKYNCGRTLAQMKCEHCEEE